MSLIIYHMAFLPLAPIERLMKSSGAERLGMDAVKAMRDLMEKEVEEITQRAVKFSKHAKRKTVQAEDIMLAGKKE